MNPSEGEARTGQARVLEAAAPKESSVGRSTELVAMIRRTESGGLRAYLDEEKSLALTREDVRERPFLLDFPLDQGGKPQPSEIILRLDSPDFEPATQTKKLKVHPSGDSEPCTFLIIPRVAGELVVNLELLKEDEIVVSRSIRMRAEPEGTSIGDAKTVVTIPLRVMVRRIGAQDVLANSLRRAQQLPAQVESLKKKKEKGWSKNDTGAVTKPPTLGARLPPLPESSAPSEREKQIQGFLTRERYGEALDVARKAAKEFPKQDTFRKLAAEAEALKKEQNDRERARNEMQRRVREINSKINQDKITDAIDLAQQTMETMGPDPNVTQLLQGTEEKRKEKEALEKKAPAAGSLASKGEQGTATQLPVPVGMPGTGFKAQVIPFMRRPAVLAGTSLLVVVLLAVGLWPHKTNGGFPSVGDLKLKQQAEELWQSGQFDQSEQAWQALAKAKGPLQAEAAEQVSQIDQKRVDEQKRFDDGESLLKDKKDYAGAQQAFQEVIDMKLWHSDDATRELDAAKAGLSTADLQTQEKQHFDQGMQLYQAKDFDKARKEFRAVVDMNLAGSTLKPQAENYLGKIQKTGLPR